MLSIRGSNRTGKPLFRFSRYPSVMIIHTEENSNSTIAQYVNQFRTSHQYRTVVQEAFQAAWNS